MESFQQASKRIPGVGLTSPGIGTIGGQRAENGRVSRTVYDSFPEKTETRWPVRQEDQGQSGATRHKPASQGALSPNSQTSPQDQSRIPQGRYSWNGSRHEPATATDRHIGVTVSGFFFAQRPENHKTSVSRLIGVNSVSRLARRSPLNRGVEAAAGRCGASGKAGHCIRDVPGPCSGDKDDTTDNVSVLQIH